MQVVRPPESSDWGPRSHPPIGTLIDMQRGDITVGEDYAVREPPKKGVEFQRVKALEFVRGSKWKVQWVEPNPGLIDYLTSKNFIVPWRDRTTFLRDEDRAAALERAVDASGFPGEDHPLTRAVELIFDAAGDRDISLFRGVLTSRGDALERFAARAGADVASDPPGYTDRFGSHHHPWSIALELAERFANLEPRTVLDEIDTIDRKWSTELRELGGQHLAPLLSQYRASFAIIRQWAGHDEAVAIREERIKELQQLLTSVMWELRRPGPDTERIARRIERALKGK